MAGKYQQFSFMRCCDSIKSAGNAAESRRGGFPTRRSWTIRCGESLRNEGFEVLVSTGGPRHLREARDNRDWCSR